MIPKKQITTQAMWFKAIEDIRHNYSDADFENLLYSTAKKIKTQCAGLNVAYGWSGGKDSLVLEKVMELAGMRECVLVITNLEYPAFLQWATDFMPPEAEVVNTGQDLPWLAKNPDWLFPKTATMAARWFKNVQHKGQTDYFHRHDLDVLIVGRRRSDGNYLGPKGKTSYTNKLGVTRYSPLGFWTHEDILKAIDYFDIELPPNYYWHRGFQVGTGPWAARQWTGTTRNGWKEVFDIDRDIVETAAEYIKSAKEFLEKK